MSETLNHSTPIIIVGAGVFGLSTAWWLARAGYRNVRVLDRWQVPSLSSASYDRNKIIRTGYVDGHFSILSQEAIQFWREPLWKDVFHPTGWLYGTDGSLDQDRAKTFDTAVSNTRTLGDPSQIVDLPDWEHMFKLYPAMEYDHHKRQRQQGAYESTQAGEPDGLAAFRGIYNSNAGSHMMLFSFYAAQHAELGGHGGKLILHEDPAREARSRSEELTRVFNEVDAKRWLVPGVVRR